ncbi:MAG: hypothetical protein RR549_01625 [Oscillospiraceae bacterium]
MRKKISAIVASVLAIAMTCSLSATFTASAGTHSAKLSDTRYRYYLANFDGASFPAGKNIKDIKGFGTDNDITNSPTGQFNATIEKYNILGAQNKALKIAYLNQDLSLAPKHTGFKIGSGKLFFPRTILGKEQGIPINANDHGMMIHVELKNLEGASESDGFVHISDTEKDAQGNPLVRKNYNRDFNITFQERDYKDGKPVPHKSKEGEPQTTAMNTGKGNKLTYIWTKDKTVSFNGPYRNSDGSWATTKNDKGVDVQATKDQTVTHKKGDYEYYITATDWDKSDASIKLPNGFCGWVLIPFSSMSSAWDGADDDGKINLQYLELANIYTSVYPQYKGEMWFDQFAFYGPTFANVKDAYDVKINDSDPAKFTQQKITDVTEPATIDEGEYSEAKNGLESTANKNDNSAETENSGENLSEEVSAEDQSGENESTTSKTSVVPGAGTSDKDNNSWIIWVIVGVVVLAGAGVGVFFYLKKRNSEDDLEGFEDGEDSEDFNDEQIDDNIQEDTQDIVEDESDDKE